MDQIDLHIGFRWFVGLTLNEPVWEASSFSKNRERLLGGEIAQEFLHAVLAQARRKHWLSDERFVVDGTLMEAWASKKWPSRECEFESENIGAVKMGLASFVKKRCAGP